MLPTVKANILELLSQQSNWLTIRQLIELSNNEFSVGAMPHHLQWLKDRGYVSERKEQKPETRRKPRNEYKITDNGRKTLEENRKKIKTIRFASWC